jgi:O-antigen/teichoic acid export membrane protein
LGAAVALGVGFGLLLLIASPFTKGAVLASLLILAASLPGLLLQDSLRLFNIAQSRPRNAFLLDAGWAVGQGLLTAGCLLTHHASIADLTFAWTGSGAVAGLIGLWLLRLRAAPGQCFVWFRNERRYIGAYLTETLALSGSAQLSLLLVAAVSGLVASAGLRGASTLFGPLNIVLNVARQAGIHELARLRQAGRSIRGATWLLAVISALVALGYGAAVMLLPDHIGRAAFGKSWAPISALVTLMTLYRIFMGLAVAPFAAARVLRMVRKTLVLRIGTSILTLVLSVGGAAVDGARGTVIGMIVSAAITAVLFFIVIARRPELDSAAEDQVQPDVDNPADLAAATAAPHPVS